VLGMKLNQLNVPVDESGGSSGAPPKPKSYSLDDTDSFWIGHAGEPFPNVASAVHEEIESFNKKRADMSKSGEGADPNDLMNPGLAAAINALPEMTEKKRSIDMHTNIATALLNEVKARELDRYYEMEDQFSSQSLSTSITQLTELINEKQRGTLSDKTRALMVLYLTKPQMTTAQLQGLVDALRTAGGDVAGFTHLQHLASMRTMMMGPSAGGPAAGAGAGGGGVGASLLGNAFGGALDKMRSQGEGLLAAGMTSVKNIVTSKKESAMCKVLDALMEHKAGPQTDNYLYLDPKAAPAPRGQEQPRIRAPFRKAVTFVVGGGNYVEMQLLQEWAQTNSRQVVYGSTDLVSPAQFVDELGNLGRGQGDDLS